MDGSIDGRGGGWGNTTMSSTINGFATDTNGLRVCPTCGGTGINPVATYLLCPKCNGEKVVSSAGAGRGGNNK